MTGLAVSFFAVREARLVLSLTTAHDALDALGQAVAVLEPGAIYADLNTGSAWLKQTLAGPAERAGTVFVDVALMAPVPGLGLRTPMLACGHGAEDYARILQPLGADVAVLAGPPGTRPDVRTGFAAT